MMDKQSMRGTSAAPAPEPEPEPTAAPEEPLRLYPKGIDISPDGTWVYSLQHEPRKAVTVSDGKLVEKSDVVSLPFKVRIPNRVWAKNIREAGRDATNEGEVLFYLSCSMCGVAPDIMDRFDARDYTIISNRVNDVLRGTVTPPGNG